MLTAMGTLILETQIEFLYAIFWAPHRKFPSLPLYGGGGRNPRGLSQNLDELNQNYVHAIPLEMTEEIIF